MIHADFATLAAAWGTMLFAGPAELAVEQKGSITIIPQTNVQRQLLVVAARQIRRNKLPKAKIDKVIKILES